MMEQVEQMRRRISGWAVSLAAVLVLTLTGHAAPQELSSKLTEGLTRYREGDFSGAVSVFEELFGESSNDDEIMDLLGRSEYGVILRMVGSDDPRISGIGLRLMKLRRSLVRQRLSDDAEIQAKVEEYLAADAQARLALKVEIGRGIGRNAVPYLVEKLDSPNDEIRTRAHSLIVEIGRDAIPVLQTAARHSSPLVRTSVAYLLGNRVLRHPAAAGTLAELAQRDTDTAVKGAGRESLMILAAQVGRTEAPAEEYYYLNARQYYLSPHTNPFNNPYYEPTTYHLRNDKVVGERVASFQVAGRLAEKSLHNALRLAPGRVEVRAMLACLDAQQLVEYELALEAFADSDPELIELLKSQEGVMRFVRGPRLLSTSRRVLFAALEQALNDENNVVATRILEVIDRTERRGTIPASVVRSLEGNPSRRVRVRGAIVLADWDAAALSPQIGKSIVNVLAESVKSSGIRTVHKVMGNPENVNRFDALFEALGLDTYSTADNVEDGIARASRIPPDLVVIDDEARAARGTQGFGPINLFIRQLRSNSRTERLPIAVAVDPSRLEAAENLYANAENKVYVISSRIDRLTLRNSVVEPAFAGLDDGKARALQLAAMAAQALARSAGKPGLPVHDVIDVLIQVLPDRPDSVRVPVLEAIGNLRAAGAAAIGPASQLFVAEENAVEVREAAMLAVAKILDASPGAASAGLLKIITDGMKSTNLQLREASYIALSASRAPDAFAVEQIFSASAPEGGSAGESETSGEEDLGDEEGDADDATTLEDANGSEGF